jgi:hypothetical protein
MNVERSQPTRRRGSAAMASCPSWCRHGGNDGGRRDRSAAQIGNFCRESRPVVPRRCGVGRRAVLSPALETSSRRHRARRLHHLRRAQVVLRAHGLRNVLLPPSRERRPGVPRRGLLHASTAAEVTPPHGATFDPLHHSAQWSRRFIGLKLFMALAQQGEQGYMRR